jgi:alcohol dehydrogenase class IV
MAPAVLAFNESVNADRQARISASFGKPGERAADIVDTFITDLGMPRSLDAVGVKAEDHALVAENTMHDFWARTNPRPVASADDVLPALGLASGPS